jgi:enoyl-CoA hydratase/carnithine racemase
LIIARHVSVGAFMTIGVEVQEHVAVIELSDPPHNFLSVEQVREIADALHGFEDDPNVRAAVLVHQGRSFCAGANLAGEGAGSSGDLYEQAARLCEASTPFIAAIQGPAIGGGLGLALTATMRVTCPEARFSANFVKLGIHHGFGLSVTLPDLVGPSRAAYVLLTGKRFNGEEATRLGLADACVPQGQVRDEALGLAREIASGAPLAISSINRTLRAGLADRVREATRHEADEQAKLFATDDSREGIKSVTERREGNFTGR